MCTSTLLSILPFLQRSTGVVTKAAAVLSTCIQDSNSGTNAPAPLTDLRHGADHPPIMLGSTHAHRLHLSLRSKIMYGKVSRSRDPTS
ncbi:hypothetical protein ACRALDRAFT_2032581 [Sodiomyces alcalophilus JCM 7366]|uniref:uncharacterized protein n=1 Tax=Sodiomyces alcalophilus JCM 7366 TaxID=591952 RepID=UPI0039B43F1A